MVDKPVGVVANYSGRPGWVLIDTFSDTGRETFWLTVDDARRFAARLADIAFTSEHVKDSGPYGLTTVPPADPLVRPSPFRDYVQDPEAA